MSEAPLFARPFRVEEGPGAFVIVDAHGRHTGVYVYWSDTTAIGSAVIQHPPKGQARTIARAVAEGLNKPPAAD